MYDGLLRYIFCDMYLKTKSESHFEDTCTIQKNIVLLMLLPLPHVPSYWHIQSNYIIVMTRCLLAFIKLVSSLNREMAVSSGPVDSHPLECPLFII